MNNARIKLPNIFIGKTKKDIKNLIEDNIYNIDKKNIAIKYYVYEMCQIDIAIEYNLDRKTIHTILNRVIEELEKIG